MYYAQLDRVGAVGQPDAEKQYETIRAPFMLSLRLASGEKIDVARELAAMAAADDLGTA